MVLSGRAPLGRRQSLCHLPCFLLVATFLTSAPAEAWTPEGYHDSFPPLWHLAPGNLEEYPVQGNKIVIAAWNYRERMGMYKIMLKHSAKYFAGLGGNNEDNILWGLPLQHGWQYQSGRLADPLNFTSCGHEDGENLCISVHSWWACANYALAIIPFLGALESGLFGDLPYEVEMLPPDELKDDFCHNIVECNNQAPKTMAGWRDYFKYLSSTAWNSEAFSFSTNEALKYMWKAHVLSLSYALPRCQNRLKHLSGPESAFGEDWSNAVDFIAATRFSTDQMTINRFQTGLPPRKLHEGDRAPLIGDFTPTQNKVLFLLSSLRNTNEKMTYMKLLGEIVQTFTEKCADETQLCYPFSDERRNFVGIMENGNVYRSWKESRTCPY